MSLWNELGLEHQRSELHPDLQVYMDRIPDLLLRSRASGTVLNYTSQLKKWTFFAKLYGLKAFPANPLDLSMFFIHLLENSHSLSTIVNVFYALNWVHSFVSDKPENNPVNNSLVRNVMESAKRSVCKPVVHKLAVPKEVLVQFCASLDASNDCLDRRDVAMFLLLFAGFLRFNELSNLRCNDIEIFESHMDLLIRKSKTDQLRLGNHTVVARTGLVSCPVQAMERYLIAAGFEVGSRGAGYLFKPGFRSGTRGGLISLEKRLSYTRATEIFRARFENLLPDVKKFSLH